MCRSSGGLASVGGFFGWRLQSFKGAGENSRQSICPLFTYFPASCRISSVIFIEQYFGPHMLQNWAVLKLSCGSV